MYRHFKVRIHSPIEKKTRVPKEACSTQNSDARILTYNITNSRSVSLDLQSHTLSSAYLSLLLFLCSACRRLRCCLYDTKLSPFLAGSSGSFDLIAVVYKLAQFLFTTRQTKFIRINFQGGCFKE